MVSAYRLTKEKQYPQPHDITCDFRGSIDSADLCTHLPIVHHDEAMLPSGKYTHPEHASFAESGDTNVCAESKIYRTNTYIRFSLTAGAQATDNIQAVRIGFMPINGAFEDFDAKDELTSVTVGAVLELTKETTDRQTYGIYTGTDITDKYTNSAHLGANAMGLTTDTGIETVAFDPDLYYDAINYYTISDKLRKVNSGLRWITLTQNNPTRVVKIRQKSSTKASNPYMYSGVLIYIPKVGSKYQIPCADEATAINHINVETRTRFLEWNDNFNHERA